MADINSQLPVRLSDGSNSAAILNTGSNDSLAVAIVDGSGNQITSFGGGTQYATNAVYADGNTGTLALTVRDDALSTLTEADGDYSTLRVDSTGALWVNLTDTTFAVTNGGTFAVQVDGAALTALQLIDDTIFVDDAAFTVGTSKVSVIGGVATSDTVDSGDAAALALDTSRNLKVIAASNSGVDIGDVTINNTAAAPIPVYITGAAASSTEVNNYDTSSAVSAAASDNHDYTVTGSVFYLKQLTASSSGKMKVELQVGPVASLVTKGVWFTTSANPSLDITFAQAIEVPVTSTGTVRIIRTNLESSAMDVYSTIIGNDI